ncbi:MAG TPA: tetratricopeptide repeat protein, partial [Candidatus Obscuribacterales bacterium]
AINGLKEVARESVSIAPTFDNFLMLAGAYQLAGDAAHARMAFEECWKRNPNSPILEKARRSFIRFVVCSPLSAPDEVEKGLERIKQNLTKNNKDAEMLYLFGRAMERKGDTTTALRAYQAASSINAYADPDLPQRISVLTGGAPPAASTASAGSLPGASASGGKPAAAAAGAPAAAAPVPQQPQKDPQRFAAIESKVRSGDTDGAIKELQALTEKDPGDGQAWYRLGAAYEKKGDLDQASVSYRQAYLLSVAEAKDALRQVDTSRIQQIKQEAEKQEAAGNWVGAAASWKEAVTIASLLPLAHRKLSIALKNLGDEKGAEKEMKKAEELEKDDKK